MKLLLVKTLILAFVAFPVMADIPKNLQTLNLKNIGIISDNTLNVSVSLTGTKELYMWEMSPSNIATLYKLIEDTPNVKQRFSKLVIENPKSDYEGLFIIITTKYGERLKTFRVYDGFITQLNGEKIAVDTNRKLEYAIWGMNYSKKSRSFAIEMLPIISFDDCVNLGNPLVETTPRQCILVNGDIFLDVGERPTQEALSIKDFDGCLVKGQAIINTFPRRCIAAGGHVYTEPPRVR